MCVGGGEKKRARYGEFGARIASFKTTYSKRREGWRRCDFYQRVSGFHYDF